MAPRFELQEQLVELLGSSFVYFQPPADIQMQYPCIVYQRDSKYESYADNGLYNGKKRYQITIIDRDSDSDILDKLAQLPECSYDRFFTADNLNHDVFNLFF